MTFNARFALPRSVQQITVPVHRAEELLAADRLQEVDPAPMRVRGIGVPATCGAGGRRKFRGGPVTKAAVGADLIILVSPSLREVSGLGQAHEFFEVIGARR